MCFTIRFTVRDVRETGRPFSFIPKGALTHHFVLTSSISLAPPQVAGLARFAVRPLPTKSTTLRGPLRQWYPSLQSGACVFLEEKMKGR